MNNTTKDFGLHESGSGGELTILNGDLNMSETLYQTIYLSLFGGNVDKSTIGNEIPNQERLDYWANDLIFKENKSKQFNSTTERVLNEVTLNSLGRLKIKSAVEEDLSFIKTIVSFNVNIVILGIGKVSIEIQLNSIGNQSNKQFQFIWDNARSEIIIDKNI